MFNIRFFQKTRKGDAIKNPSISDIKIIVGLGNPGEEYKLTYHNVGSMFTDFLVSQIDNDNETRANKWTKAQLFDYVKVNDLIIVKPNIFMNTSGAAVKNSLKYFNVKPENLLVVHDDSDIFIGKYKLYYGGGAAGHHGIESITKILKTNSFHRLRIGIRFNRDKAGSFVLKQISKTHRETLEELFGEIKATHLESHIK